MIPGLPVYLYLIFLLTVSACLLLFARAMQYRKGPVLACLALLLVQGLLGWSGFYTHTERMPPRFPLLILPALILIAPLFFSERGKAILHKLSLPALTAIHVLRIPVELTLHGLYLEQQVPEIMTYQGLNFDILSGISALILMFTAFPAVGPKKRILLVWNLICLALLMNIVIISILASPTPFRQPAFDPPNRVVQFFPFVWLPAFIVPSVLFAHLAAIWKLMVDSRQSIVGSR